MTEDACSEPESLAAVLSNDHVNLGALLSELLCSLDEANVDEAYALRSDHDVFMSELKDAVKAVRTVVDGRDGKLKSVLL